MKITGNYYATMTLHFVRSIVIVTVCYAHLCRPTSGSTKPRKHSVGGYLRVLTWLKSWAADGKMWWFTMSRQCWINWGGPGTSDSQIESNFLRIHMQRWGLHFFLCTQQSHGGNMQNVSLWWHAELMYDNWLAWSTVLIGRVRQLGFASNLSM